MSLLEDKNKTTLAMRQRVPVPGAETPERSRVMTTAGRDSPATLKGRSEWRK